jgi:type II secretory pathway component PulF
MGDAFRELYSGDQSIVVFIGAFIAFVLFGLLPILGFLYLLYILLTLPMRRNERARFFIDLLELGIKDGHSPEAALLDVAGSYDRSLGARFRLLATHLAKGLRLSAALEKVPRLVPPQVQAALAVGERIGDVGKVLSACRALLRDGVSQVRGALNYVAMFVFFGAPFAVFIQLVIRIKVLPAFEATFTGITEEVPLPAFTRMVFSNDRTLLLIQCLVFALLWVAILVYLGGPRLRRWLDRLVGEDLYWLDWLLCRIPWRRKRLQRDFSRMLALLLENHVPEVEAVSLAGESTANLVMRRRAQRAVQLLRAGTKLPEALRVLDDAGELRWRLANALERSGGFMRSLAGWHESLDARAFQLEQTAAQIITTLLVLLNGVIVGCILAAVFLALIQIINQATLW